MSDKFSFSEKKLIEEFQLKAKKDKLGKNLEFTTNLHVRDNVYETSEKMQITGQQDARFKISDFFSFKVSFKKEHIDNITFIKYISKNIFSNDIITIKIFRENVRGSYAGYASDLGPEVGIRVNSDEKKWLDDYFNFYLQTLLMDLKKDKDTKGSIVGDYYW